MRIVMMFLCVLAGASVDQPDPAEEVAIKAVRKLGCSVTQNGKAVFLASDITDAGLKELMKELAALKGLNSLDLRWSLVTDAGLKELAAIRNLTKLDLSLNPVTDAGVKDLYALKKLTRLDLTETKVTEAGVMEFKQRNPNCEVLY